MPSINVSVVYATKDKQWIKELVLQRGASISDAIENSGFLDQIDDLTEKLIDELDIGVFSQKAKLDDLLKEGDRVEIYRPLRLDPKDVRRQLAALGKTIGKTVEK